MTTEEARSQVGRVVLYSDGTAGPVEVVITWVGAVLTYIRWRHGFGEHKAVYAGESLTPVPVQPPATVEDQADRGQLAASQARLNEFAAGLIRNPPGDRRLAAIALRALREHNRAWGFTFDGARGPDSLPPAMYRKTALLATEELELRQQSDEANARAAAFMFKHSAPPEAAVLERQPGYKADGPALVYLITHAAFQAAKVGVSDAAGERIAVHRRAGWQLLAAFQVAAGAAAAIEADVLSWWRRDLGLPPYLTRAQMPHNGWTETVAAGRIDLAATAARLCELALRPASRRRCGERVNLLS